jgi:GxxExxY protein
MVEDKVIIELKSVETITKTHHKIFNSYLKHADKKLGLMVNFTTDNILESIYRKANGMQDENISS